MGFQRLKRRVQKSKRPTKKIKKVLAFSKVGLAQKPRPIFFSRFVHTCHMPPLHSTGFQRSKRQFQISIGICFSRRVSICILSFTEITGSFSKHRFQPSAFPDVSTSITWRISFVKITGSLSKRRFQISKRHLLFQTCQRLSYAHSALRKSRAICRRFLVK
ncbi:hypothetical protein ACFXTH_019382 [Malus domestica]